MIEYSPILMNYREKPVHLVWNVLKVRRRVLTDVNWFLAITTSELAKIGDRGIVERPERVLIEELDTLKQTDFNAIGQ